MRRLILPALFVGLLLCSGLPVAAKKNVDSAKVAYDKGTDAEARRDYEQAFDFFKQAYTLKPKDLKYRTAFERNRFEAASEEVHRGQILRDAGKLDEALVQFEKALLTDPSSFIAQQELKRTEQMIKEAQGAPPQAAATTPLRRRLDAAQGPVGMAAISNVPITLKVTEKSNVIYETVGKLAGINVLFDPDYTARQVHVELNNVTLEEALEIISFETKTFWRPVTPNTIFVAQDNPAKRKELEQNVIKTFYLSNLSQPTELQDVVNAMRTILEVSRIQQLPSQGAIVVRGTPDQVALAQKLVDDLDKAKPEVLVEVAVMQVSKDKMHTLGINPPTSVSVQLQPNITTTPTTTGTTGGTTTTTGSTGSGINLNTLGSLNATDFQVTIPQMTATALLSDTNTKIIQNPQIRALDGQKASLKIGDRVPVATGSFQPGIGGVGINPLVNTQFQYLDVGVNIDITPRVHAGREVTLKIVMDISSVTGQSSIGGISQPIIGQRKIEHEIRLKDGEANLLGGMMEDQQTKSLAGIPGLAQIPILRYLFGQTQQDHSENEVIFAIVPHIIRSTDVNEINQRAIDIGTSTTIALRHVNKAAAVPQTTAPVPANPGAAPVNLPANQGPTNQSPAIAPPGSTSPPSGPGASNGAGASFLFDPATVTATKGNTFVVNLLISGAQNVYSVPVQMNYDPARLQLVNVSNGGFLSQDGQAVALVHREDEATGTLQITATRPPGAGGVSGQGAVVTMTFQAK